jgi:signal transduction histidine kinase
MRKLYKSVVKNKFFQTNLLTNFLIVSLVLIAALPTYIIFFLNPTFTTLLVETTKENAVRVANHFVSWRLLEKTKLEKGFPGVDIMTDIERLKSDFDLLKLKVFSDSGEVTFSTDHYDIGDINREEYFHEIVRKGITHSEVILQGNESLEGQKMAADVVETYVPLMRDDKFLGAFEIYYDITARKKQLDNLLRSSSVSVLSLALVLLIAIIVIFFKEKKTINERQEAEVALRQSSEQLKFFAYSVMHDLKSPAIGIYGLTELLHKHYKDTLDERGKRYCDQILKASVHVAALIEKINVYIATKEASLKIEKIKVKEILQILREEFSSRLAARQIGWVEPEPMIEIKADKLSLLRVFRNLVDNALKYGGKDLSEIRIEYRESERFHTFSISDNGVGIEGEDYEKIFALFQRDAKSKGVEGAGLGLAIVREIAEQHGGKVWIEPGKERGTTFHISLPKDL